MTFGRHTPSSSPNRVDDAVLLRAARECVLANGIRRSTLTEVARRAGVSRMTLYRRFPDVRSMVTTLVTVEFQEILHQARVDEEYGSARIRLVTAIIRGVRMLRSAPLPRRIAESDPELMLPYLLHRLGSLQQLAEQFLYDHLLAGHADGSIRRAEPGVQARVLLMSVQSFVVSAGPAESDLDPDDVTAELAHLLDAALRPESAVEIAPLMETG